MDPGVPWPLLDAIQSAVVVADSSATVLFMNRAARELHGLDRSATTGRRKDDWPEFNLFDEQGRPVGPESLPIVRASRGETVEGERYLVRFCADDSLHLWEYSAVPFDQRSDEAPDGPSVVLTIRDLTASLHENEATGRSAGREAAAALDRLEVLLELLPVGVAICDSQGKIVLSNSMIDTIWGSLPRANDFGEYQMYRGWWADTGAPLLPEDWGLYRAVSFGETTIGEAIDIARFDGARATILNSAAPIRSERGSITGAVAVLQDVTESTRRERLERHLAEAIRDILECRDRESRVLVGARWLGTMFDARSVVYLEVRDGELVSGMRGVDVESACSGAVDAARIWGSLSTGAVQLIRSGPPAEDPDVIVLPVVSERGPLGAYVARRVERAPWTDIEARVAERFTRILPLLFDVMRDRARLTTPTDRCSAARDERHPATGASADDAELTARVLSGFTSGSACDPGAAALRFLGSALTSFAADYGRVVEIGEVAGSPEVRLIAESPDSPASEREPPSFEVFSAIACREPVFVSKATEVEHGFAGSFITCPFKIGSTSAALTLAWRDTATAMSQSRRGIAIAAQLLGLHLGEVHVRSALESVLESQSFIAEVGRTTASSLDPAGVGISVARLFKARFGAVTVRLYGLDADAVVREIRNEFSAAESGECPWGAIEALIGRDTRPFVRLTTDDTGVSSLIELTPGEHAFVLPLVHRRRSVGVMAVVFDDESRVQEEPDPWMLAALPEIAASLDVAQRFAAQARAGVHASVVHRFGARLSELSTVDDRTEAAMPMVADAISVQGAALLRMSRDGWEVQRTWGSLTGAAATRLAQEHSRPGPRRTSRQHSPSPPAIIAIDEDEALVVLRGASGPQFKDEDRELLHRLLQSLMASTRQLCLTEQRERQLQAQEQWLADVSHDLKTPLASIHAYAQLLSSEHDTAPEEVRREARAMLRQTAQINALIESLLLAFRLRADALPVKIEDADANEIVSEVVDLIRADPRSDGRAPVIERTHFASVIQVDRRLLVRALCNVGLNAYVHNPAHTPVSIRVRDEGGACRIEVVDEGKGMSATELESVLQRYRQGSPAKGDRRGSGLGLPIAKGLVELMGGAFLIDSTPGRGTTIEIEFVRRTGDRGPRPSARQQKR